MFYEVTDDRRRKMMRMNNGGYNLAQMLRDGATFYAPRTSSITQTRGAGTPTETRATVATVTNNDGYQVTALAGELRFPGTRRVRNLLVTSSEDFSVTTGPTSNATPTADSVVFTATSAYRYKRTVAITGPTIRCSCKVKSSDGSKAVVGLRGYGVSSAAAAFISVTLTATYQRVSILITGATVGEAIDFGLENRSGNGGDDTTTGTIQITEIQVEDVTAQTTQTAGEYVSVGVLSAPYHGAGVDGVKYFSTDISGAPIPAATLKGAVVEAAATNLWTYSQEFDNAAWTKSTITVAANDAVAPDGTTTADKLTNDDTASVLDRTATVTANTTYTDSIHLKYGNNAWARILYGTGADAAQMWVNIQTGTIGTVTASSGTAVLSAYSIESVSGGFWRIQAAVNLGGAITAFQRRSYLVNADNSGTIVAAAYAHHWGAQIELGPFATAYIPTTTAAVTRNKDVLDDQVASNLTAAAGTVAFTWTPSHAPSGTIALCGSYVDASNYTQILHDATNLFIRKRIAGVNYDAPIANAFVSGTTYDIALRWGADGTQIAVDGVLGTAHANTTAAQLGTRWQWGADGNSAQQAGAAFKEMYLLPRAWSDSELRAMTQ